MCVCVCVHVWSEWHTPNLSIFVLIIYLNTEYVLFVCKCGRDVARTSVIVLTVHCTFSNGFRGEHKTNYYKWIAIEGSELCRKSFFLNNSVRVKIFRGLEREMGEYPGAPLVCMKPWHVNEERETKLKMLRVLMILSSWNISVLVLDQFIKCLCSTFSSAYPMCKMGVVLCYLFQLVEVSSCHIGWWHIQVYTACLFHVLIVYVMRAKCKNTSLKYVIKNVINR